MARGGGGGNPNPVPGFTFKINDIAFVESRSVEGEVKRSYTVVFEIIATFGQRPAENVSFGVRYKSENVGTITTDDAGKGSITITDIEPAILHTFVAYPIEHPSVTRPIQRNFPPQFPPPTASCKIVQVLKLTNGKRITVFLKNSWGGAHQGKQVRLTRLSNGSSQEETTNADGQVIFTIPGGKPEIVTAEALGTDLQDSSWV